MQLHSSHREQLCFKKCVTVTVLSLLLIGLCALSLVYNPQEAQKRTKRSSSADEFIFQNAVHRVTWAKPLDAPPERPKTELKDIFISVKTSQKFHETRLKIILETWYRLAEKQTWFFSDARDSQVESAVSPGHLIATRCPSSHNRSALCCKMAAEIKAFIRSKQRWFCHFDDDNYVNVPALVRVLRRFDPEMDWYLGKTSIQEPMTIMDRDSKDSSKTISFWFATGGAGFCLSRALVDRLEPLVYGDKLVQQGDQIRLPDDVTLGYLIEHKLGLPLTLVKEFHSHLEPLKLIPRAEMRDQVSFSYSTITRVDGSPEENIVNISGLDSKADPTRFFSLHCFLFPNSLRHCKEEAL